MKSVFGGGGDIKLQPRDGEASGRAGENWLEAGPETGAGDSRVKETYYVLLTPCNANQNISPICFPRWESSTCPRAICKGVRNRTPFVFVSRRKFENEAVALG